LETQNQNAAAQGNLIQATQNTTQIMGGTILSPNLFYSTFLGERQTKLP